MVGVVGILFIGRWVGIVLVLGVGSSVVLGVSKLFHLSFSVVPVKHVELCWFVQLASVFVSFGNGW